MKVDKVIDIINAIDGEGLFKGGDGIPTDIIDILDVSHWSEGLEDYIDVGDMDIYHLLRTFNLLLRDREKLTKVIKALEIENE
jgi:hypothetical protein|tara:strand:+ start:73 stop:321 length:249 start_codon:yes stop_codon:yes gene_type:complete